MGASVRVMDEGEIAGMTSHRPRWRKKRYAVPGLSLLTLLAVFLMAWANRESIAHDFIRDQFDAYGIEGTYQIERIGGQTHDRNAPAAYSECVHSRQRSPTACEDPHQ